jgi:hypothetical protein
MSVCQKINDSAFVTTQPGGKTRNFTASTNSLHLTGFCTFLNETYHRGKNGGSG